MVSLFNPANAFDSGAPIRGEQWVLTWAPEVTAGTDPGTAALVNVFGVHQQASMPDPKTEMNHFWMLGNNSYRNYFIAYKGRRTSIGSIPDTLLLGGSTLYLPIGSVTTTGTDSGAGNSTLNGGTAVGATSITLADASGYSNGDYIQIGTVTNPEVRKILSIAGAPTLTLTQALSFAHLTGVTCNQVIAPFTHTVNETFQLPTITIHAEMYSADQTLQLIRRFMGGRVGSSSITAREGEYLTQSFGDLSFNNMKWYSPTPGDSHFVPTSDPFFTALSGSFGAVTPFYPTTQPYLFSYGALSLNGNIFARVRGFKLDISNNLNPKYYIQATVNNPQFPFEYREGQRNYRLSVDIDVVDATLYHEIMVQGTYSSTFKGFQTILQFEREGSATDVIVLTLPPSAPAIGGNAQGCFFQSGNYDISSQEPIVHDTPDILARSMKIEVIDAVANLPE